MPDAQRTEGIETGPGFKLRGLRWWIVGLIFLATLINYIDRLTISVLAPVITRDLGLTNTEFGGILTWFLFAYTISQGLSGKLYDRVGTKLGFVFSIILWSLAAMAHAFARGLTSLSIFRFVLGLGEAGNWPGAAKTVAEWFPIRERAFGMAIFNSGAAIGSVLAPPLIVWLSLTYGWQTTFIVTGSLGFAWLVLWLLFYQTPDRHQWLTEEERKLILDGQRIETAHDATTDIAEEFRWRELLRYRQVWAIVLARFLTDPIWWLYISWLPKYLADARGFSLAKIGLFAWVPYVAADAGSLSGGWLSGYLIGRGIAFNGIVLISTIMNFETTDFAAGNDLPYVMFLPSYAATAWYHKKLPPDLQSKSVQKVVAEVEQWATNEYTLALGKGDRLTGQERQDVVATLARYTGLSPQFVDNANLRVSLGLFRKELLRSEKRSIGRLDARFKGFDANYATDSPDFDASEAAIRPPYTSTFNNYVRSELGYKTDLEYYILGGGITSPWNWNTNNGYVDTSIALRSALARNPYLKIFVAMGYYDMATPYFAVDYTLHHISLDPMLLKNFSTGYYEAGHMMYIDEKQLGRLRTDVGKFIDDSQRK